MPKAKPVRSSRRHSVARRRKPAAASKALARIPAGRELSLPERVEQVLIAGDLTPLTPAERVEYYRKVCQSLGLNWLTQPFTYILFRETDNAPPKLQLYANKDCAAQLRKLHGVSVIPPLRKERDGGMFAVEADVRDRYGKVDTATGVVPLWKWKDSKQVDLSGRELANALMKCETKAKRRATLSICGLAFLDESELDTMQVIGGVTKDGRIFEFKQPQLPEGQAPSLPGAEVENYLSKLSPEDRAKEEAALRRHTPAAQEVLARKLSEHMPIDKYADVKASLADCGNEQQFNDLLAQWKRQGMESNADLRAIIRSRASTLGLIYDEVSKTWAKVSRG